MPVDKSKLAATEIMTLFSVCVSEWQNPPQGDKCKALSAMECVHSRIYTILRSRGRIQLLKGRASRWLWLS